MAESAGLASQVMSEENMYVAPGHIWVAPTSSGDVRMGIDKVLKTLLGNIECIYPQPEGAVVGKGGPLLMLRNGNRALKVRSPIDGVITRVNHHARENPNSLNAETDEDSWIYELTPSRLTRALKEMKHGKEAAAWLQNESQRLQDLSLSFINPILEGQAVMADGGVLIEELGTLIEDYVEDESWEKLVARFFSESH
jgi:glycine cleavage system H lipoate-binding protein